MCLINNTFYRKVRKYGKVQRKNKNHTILSKYNYNYYFGVHFSVPHLYKIRIIH